MDAHSAIAKIVGLLHLLYPFTPPWAEPVEAHGGVNGYHLFLKREPKRDRLLTQRLHAATRCFGHPPFKSGSICDNVPDIPPA